ncbi:hypothetical protein F5879DRAFT_630222 [Lentinula edodes]|nr:hypothetical protein F5879DRAFT_630222 [Lentinula edodes]
MSTLSDVWLLLDDPQMTFSAGSQKVLPANTGAWIGNTSSTIGGDISIAFQGTSISFTGDTSLSTTSPTWFLAGIDLNSPYNVSFPGAGTQIYTQWYQTPMLPDGLHFVNLSSIFVNVDYAIITAGATTQLNGSTIVVDDRSSEITYTGTDWATSDTEIILGSGWVNGPPLGNTTHRTSNVGDGFSFRFAGSKIDVYGVFEWTATGNVDVDFVLDGETTSSSLFVPLNTVVVHPEILNYQLFSSGNLLAGNHTLIMNITQANGNQSFILDYLTYQPSFSFLAGKPNFTASASSASDSPLSSASNTGMTGAMIHNGMNIGAIVGGVLGGLIGIFISLLFFLWRWRRHRADIERRLQESIFQPFQHLHRKIQTPQFATTHTDSIAPPAPTRISGWEEPPAYDELS